MQPNKILITGEGQLGSFYRDYFQEKGVDVVNTDSSIDIRNQEKIREKIEQEDPDLLIHTAAKTDIDWCEQNRTKCFEVNTLGADNVGEICEDNDIYMVHLSSGCVLESKTEDDIKDEQAQPNPLCFYSWTKLWAEEMLEFRARNNDLDLLILRPRQLMSAKVSPRNALTKMLTYDKFIDTPNSCTVVEDLMEVTNEMIEKDLTGKYHIANPGVTTPHEIAQNLDEIIGLDSDEFEKITKEELNDMTLAERVDAVLDISKMESEGIELKNIHDRMREVMRQLKENMETKQAQEVINQTQQDTEEKLNLVD
jgi:dTDP-4-dehydrorhamnose reductase